MPSAVMAHHAHQVSAVVQSVALDVAVDEHMGLETCAEAACNRHEVAAAGHAVGSAAWRSAQAFADDPGRRRSARLDLWACVCTVCTQRSHMKALPLTL